MSNENKNPIDKAIDAGKNIIKSAGKDYWIRSFTKYVSKYPKLKDIPGLEYLSKTNPKLAEYNTKDFKILFEGLVGAESSYRKTVNKNEKTQYKGWYALPYKDGEKELLDDDNYQHTKAFKHFVTNSMFRFTKEDFARAKQLGYSEDEFIAMTWNNGSNTLNYIYNGDNPKDGNGTTLDKYVDMYRSHRTNTNNLNFTQVVPHASQNLQIPIKPGDVYDKKQRLIRGYGREYNYAGGDLFRGNPKDSIRVMVNKGLRAGETLDLTGFKRTPPKSKIPYIKGGYPQNDNEFKLMMNDLQTIINNSNVKKFGGKLRYGWGGIMSQESIRRDIVNNPKKYGFDKIQDFTYMTKTTGAGFPEQNDAYLGTAFDAYDFKKAYNNGENVTLDYTPDDGHYAVAWSNAGEKGWVFDAQRHLYLNEAGLNAINNFMAQQQQTLVNMQNRIDDDIVKVAKTKEQSQPIVRYGGVLIRPRFDYGGYYSDYNAPRIPYTNDYSMNNPITAEDIPDSKAMYGVEPIRQATVLKGAGTGASIGGSVGALAGGIGAGAGAAALTAAGATAWIPVIGPLVALVAAGIGAGIGAGASKKKADQAAAQQLAQNKQQIAYNAELNRQKSIGNVINRIDKDVYKIQNTENNFNMSQGFYSKYGGIIKPRMKYANGGTILPNSNNTVVAFGRTHEQMNPMTGETGITYGNAEIEGGGYVNGRELPGEVVRATPYGDEVFSDSIPIDDQGYTVADYAKMISDRKGIIEKIMNETRLNMERDIKNLNVSRTAKAKTGTLIRNIEKQAALFNKYTAESAKLDSDLEKLFAYQEQAASAMGLREGQPMKYGGSIRRTYDVGGWLSPVLSFGMNALTSGLQYWAADADAKYKQEILNGLAKRTLPKRAKEDPILLDPEYDITPEINATEREASRIEKYIRDNVVNPQQARNLLSKVRLDKLEQQNKLRGIKKSEERKLINANIASIITNRNKMRVNQYEDLLDQFNYDTNLAVQEMMINSQKTQATQQLLRDLGQSATQAAQMYVASKAWAPGVTKDMNGNVVGGNFKRMSAKDLKNHRYSLMFNSDVNATDFNALKHFNTKRYAKWYAEMLKRGFI